MVVLGGEGVLMSEVPLYLAPVVGIYAWGSLEAFLTKPSFVRLIPAPEARHLRPKSAGGSTSYERGSM